MVFTTRKLESCLPTLKPAFSNDLKLRVVYKLSISGCTFTYVGQTVRHQTLKLEEHKKADSPVGLHLDQRSLKGKSAGVSLQNIDRSNNQTKLLTLEAINIRKDKQGLIMRDEFRSRELTENLVPNYFNFLLKIVHVLVKIMTQKFPDKLKRSF